MTNGFEFYTSRTIRDKFILMMNECSDNVDDVVDDVSYKHIQAKVRFYLS